MTPRRLRLTLTLLSLVLLGTRPARADAEASPAPKAAKVEQVVVAFKTHFDIGYTDLAVNVVRRYRTTMIDQALKVCDQSRGLPPEQQFVWTIPGWPMTKITEDWPGQTPERKARVLEAFKSGRFVVHALPFTTHTELLEAEDLVRGLGFASRLSRFVGLALPRDAKMTDVPCHSWIVPTLLRHAGVDFFHIGCNAGSSSPSVPPLFWWEGPDGSRLLTMYSETYGTGLVPPADWPYKTWLALIHTGDNHGPPTPEEVKRVLDEAKVKLPGVKVRIGRLSDFADALLAEKPNLPVVRGDVPDTWIHGPMCDPAGAQIARTTRPKIAAAESLATLLRLWGVKAPDATGPVADAYEKSLLYGEHTWGGAQYWITGYGKKTNFPYGEAWKKDRAEGRFQRLEASWAEHTNYIETARDRIAPIADAGMETLAQAVNVEGDRVVVFNPLPWKRDGLVAFQAGPAMKNCSAAEPANGGGPVTPLVHEGQSIRFFARGVPAMGYRAYRLADAEAKRPPVGGHMESKTMENSFLKVVLDPIRGTVRSLVDKRSGRELIDDSAAHGFGQYLYERFDANQTQGFVKAYGKVLHDWVKNEFGKPSLPSADQAPYQAVSPKGFALRWEDAPMMATAVMIAQADGALPAVTTRVSLPADQPYVEIAITLHKKPADPWPEAGWLCLPLAVNQPQLHLGRLGSIIDPACDIIPGANHNIMALNSGMAVTGPQGRGVGLCPMDHPLVSLETPGCWKYSRDFVPRKPMVYINLFNNQWTTNFRMWNEGTWTSRVRIWAIDRYDPESSLVTPCWEARLPLMAFAATGKGGQLPPSRAGVELSRRGVLVTAFGQNPDGAGTVLRLWELAGGSGPCEVRLPEGMRPASVQPIDLRGQPAGKSLAATEGKFTLPLRGFAPASVLIR